MRPRTKKNILIAGLPGVGKTVLLKNVVGHLGRTDIQGFYTEEIRKRGKRVGFSLKTIDGRLCTLAHVSDVLSQYRVGRYKVDLETFERVVDEELKVQRGVSAYVVDEIGKMECLSSLFRRRLIELLESEADVIATVAAKGDEYIDAVKDRSDVTLIYVTPRNRDEMLKEVVRLCGVAE